MLMTMMLRVEVSWMTCDVSVYCDGDARRAKTMRTFALKTLNAILKGEGEKEKNNMSL